MFLDDLPVGYFPGALWQGTYTSAQVVSVFGEVAENAADSPSCTQMGDGRFGSSSAITVSTAAPTSRT